ncbi:type II toxin-antitoxin system HipA family toxin [Desulfovibrio sp. OttesenSCG-928-F20]|nr:type II toxin-antitoxin system HipA family toxin [Desulfovibrio sp. OttesenSCG-928-F20]
MSQKVHIHMEVGGKLHFVGRLWFHKGRDRGSATFEYDRAWLNFSDAFALDPALPLIVGQYHTGPGQELFGCFRDCSPDRWGRTLMQRSERAKAKTEKRTARTLQAGDFLLLVSDLSRQGAIRITDPDDTVFFTTAESGIPTAIKLGDLLSAARHIAAKTESAEDLKLLFGPCASLGGARPKAMIQDASGRLFIAKFPKDGDEWDVPLWEAVSLTLAREAGIETPNVELRLIQGKNVLLVERFDRVKERRIPFASAMTLLGMNDGDRGSYLDIADILNREGAETKKDLAQLWQRMVFNFLTSNVDDHLRNHGFLRYATGWKLSPVYDLETTPPEVAPRELHTVMDPYDSTSSIDKAIEISEHFGLTKQQAKALARKTGEATSRWQRVARAFGASAHDLDSMQDAFLKL